VHPILALRRRKAVKDSLARVPRKIHPRWSCSPWKISLTRPPDRAPCTGAVPAFSTISLRNFTPSPLPYSVDCTLDHPTPHCYLKRPQLEAQRKTPSCQLRWPQSIALIELSPGTGDQAGLSSLQQHFCHTENKQEIEPLVMACLRFTGFRTAMG
jgi:hypothetical protein